MNRGTRLVWVLGILSFVAMATPAGAGVLWQDQLDSAGAFDRANVVAASGRFSFAAGFVTDASGDAVGVVRAYDAATGSVAWENQLDLGAGGGYIALAPSGRTLYACGLGSSGAGPLFVVRAFDARTGVVLWDDLVTAGGATDVRVDRGVVVVGGYGIPAGGGLGSLVRAYDARTGALLWENAISDGGFVNAIHTQGGRVYTAGAGNAEADGREHFVVRAYSERTGALLWEHQDGRAGVGDFAASVKAANGRVHVAGTVSHDDGSCTFDFFTGNCDYLVRTLDATTGALLWEDQVDKTGHRDHAYSVVVLGDRIVTGGLGSTDFTRNYLVRAYDAGTGGLLWEDNPTDRGGAVNSLAAEGDTVYAGGDGALPEFGSSLDFLVRAYDVATGGMLWEDKYDHVGGADAVLGIAVRRGRVVAGGGVVNEADDVDWFVRSYSSEGEDRP